MSVLFEMILVKAGSEESGQGCEAGWGWRDGCIICDGSYDEWTCLVVNTVERACVSTVMAWT